MVLLLLVAGIVEAEVVVVICVEYCSVIAIVTSFASVCADGNVHCYIVVKIVVQTRIDYRYETIHTWVAWNFQERIRASNFTYLVERHLCSDIYDLVGLEFAVVDYR